MYKQIKEMQKIIEHCCNVYDDKGNYISNKCNTYDCEYYCDTNNVCCSFSFKEATALYNAGYRKIPQDATVLTEEQYAILSFNLHEAERQLQVLNDIYGSLLMENNLLKDKIIELKSKILPGGTVCLV